MIWDRFDEYFGTKNINVRYNTLGSTQDLVLSYVKDFHNIVDNSAGKKSNYVKHSCYSTIYDLEPREKKTGFENFVAKDREFRAMINKDVVMAQINSSLIVDLENTNFDGILSFKEELENTVSGLDNPLLYLSGGLDSELVGMALVSTNTPFIPVIFNLRNSSGELQNGYDVEYATKFCSKFNLDPVIRDIDVESLWEDELFKDLAKDMQVISTQLLTHAYMITLIDREFPGKTHLFGGEVRFVTNHMLDDGRPANLVQLGKLAPGYNGNNYIDQVPLIGGTNSVSLNYNSGTGGWSISGASSGSPTSGSWTDTPGSSYEYQISSVTVNENSGSPTSYSPTSSGGYTAISGVVTLCTVTAGPGIASIDVTYGINVKVVGQGSPVQSSTIQLGAAAEV